MNTINSKKQTAMKYKKIVKQLKRVFIYLLGGIAGALGIWLFVWVWYIIFGN